MINLTKLEKNLGLTFNHQELLKTALTHRSCLNETKEKELQSNERLEFLGDAVLSLVVSKFLYEKFSTVGEGDLTNYRASLVKGKALAKVAIEIGLGSYLLLSRGEEEENGRQNPGLLADALEALIGAIFIDQGLESASSFISRHLLPLLPAIIASGTFRDHKSLLQENVQAKLKAAPAYKVLVMSGPDHERVFTVGVFLGTKKLGEGKGRSKQEAEREAARVALENFSNFE